MRGREGKEGECDIRSTPVLGSYGYDTKESWIMS